MGQWGAELELVQSRKAPSTKSDTPESAGVGFPKNNLGSVTLTMYRFWKLLEFHCLAVFLKGPPLLYCGALLNHWAHTVAPEMPGQDYNLIV